MSSTAISAADVSTPVAPWWHTVIVLLVLAAGSLASARLHGLPRVPVAGIDPRVAGYLFTLAMEWVMVLVIWLGLRSRGISVRNVVSGRWGKITTFLRDLGLAVAFLVVALPCLEIVARLLRANYDATAITPRSAVELILWLLLAASAGFCEELTFRGYLNRQFSGWTGSPVIGMVLQGLAFGLAHGYQGWRMMTVIMVFGWMFGALALWRRSLLPGMLAHGIQDSAGGLVYFFTHR
jgi:membrane protease YdiL (CAAX protease family)